MEDNRDLNLLAVCQYYEGKLSSLISRYKGQTRIKWYSKLSLGLDIPNTYKLNGLIVTNCLLKLG